jgi:hypothetical protein
MGQEKMKERKNHGGGGVRFHTTHANINEGNDQLLLAATLFNVERKIYIVQ